MQEKAATSIAQQNPNHLMSGQILVIIYKNMQANSTTIDAVVDNLTNQTRFFN
jgi:hypothetical protein